MAKEKNPQYGNKISTGECFASFPHLDNVDSGREYSDNKYKVDAIFTSKEAMMPIVEACKKLAIANNKTVEGVKMPWKNGDEGSVTKYQGYSGHFYIVAKTGENRPPVIVGPDAKPGFDANKIYSGAIIKVNVTPKFYEMLREVVVIEDGVEKTQKRKMLGITLYLNGVQFVRDSEHFGQGEDPTGGFTAVEGYETTDDNALFDDGIANF